MVYRSAAAVGRFLSDFYLYFYLKISIELAEVGQLGGGVHPNCKKTVGGVETPFKVDMNPYIIGCSFLGKPRTSKTDELSEKFRKGGGHFQSKNLYCKIWTFKQGYLTMKLIQV